jgi:hypothetical protein
MQISTRSFVDSNPTISLFFQKPSVSNCLSPYWLFIEEIVNVKKSAPVLTISTLWRSQKNFRHALPLIQSMKITKVSKNLILAKEAKKMPAKLNKNIAVITI